jgi:hypothetical protein
MVYNVLFGKDPKVVSVYGIINEIPKTDRIESKLEESAHTVTIKQEALVSEQVVKTTKR